MIISQNEVINRIKSYQKCVFQFQLFPNFFLRKSPQIKHWKFDLKVDYGFWKCIEGVWWFKFKNLALF